MMTADQADHGGPDGPEGSDRLSDDGGCALIGGHR
jgi:hypothetical protein